MQDFMECFEVKVRLPDGGLELVHRASTLDDAKKIAQEYAAKVEEVIIHDTRGSVLDISIPGLRTR